MGAYDTYGEQGIQIKIGECDGRHYRVGESVLIPDGIYLGYEGVVVIQDGRLAMTVDSITTKWGDILRPETVIGRLNPVEKEVELLIERLKKL